MFPYLDLLAFKARTVIPSADVDTVETFQPGYTSTRIAVWTSWINSRLRKRYGNAPGVGNSLPLGQTAPALVAAGSSPPPVALDGRPTLGSLAIAIAITTVGPLGAAVFQWSQDGGRNWVSGVTTAPRVVLGSTGLAANFPTGSYATDNVYAASTPVPETVLGWIVALVSVDVMRKRGVNPQDPQIELLVAEATRVQAEVKEAADSHEGLFDLPASEDKDSAVTTAGPLGYSETSPYVWTTQEAQAASQDDARGRGQ